MTQTRECKDFFLTLLHTPKLKLNPLLLQLEKNDTLAEEERSDQLPFFM